MGEAFLVRRGGSSKLFAIISVSYPAGSVCTCTMGSKVLKAKNTSGKALFNVPALGTWTVSCTDGSNTASKDVSITTEGQNESVKLSYFTYYYNKGDQCTEVTGGWIKTTRNGSGGSLAFNQASMTLYANAYQVRVNAATKNGVDLTNIKTLYFSVKSATTYGTQGYPQILISTRNDPDSANTGDYVARKTLSASSSFSEVSIDVSALTGSFYIVFTGLNGDSGPATIEVQAVWGDDK